MLIWSGLWVLSADVSARFSWDYFTMSHLPMVGSALKVPLFHGLDPEQMSQLVRRAERVAFDAGDTLIQNGYMGDAAILVITGRATQFNPFSTLHPYDAIEPGSLVGEMAMLVETTHHLTVVADTPINALKFHRSMIEAVMADDPRLADHFVARIASRLTDLAAEMRAALADPSAAAAQTLRTDTLGQTFQGSPVGETSTAEQPPTLPIN